MECKRVLKTDSEMLMGESRARGERELNESRTK